MLRQFWKRFWLHRAGRAWIQHRRMRAPFSTMEPAWKSDVMNIGVALCTFNGAAYLRAQLDSISAQSKRPSHVVIADDGSSDATLEIVRAWAAEAESDGIRVTVIEAPGPGGVTANFERALLAVDGDLIALCDQDDLWFPERLERAAAAFVTDDILLHHSNARVVKSDGVTEIALLASVLGFPNRWPNPPGGVFAQLVRRNLVTGATTMIRRSLLEFATPFPSSWVHDEWLAVLAAAHGNIAYTSEPLIGYRQHGANQIGVAALGLRGKLRRMNEPRGDHHQVLATRSRDLVERLASTSAPAAWQALARDKEEFERRRATWPSSRGTRWLHVIREMPRRTYPRLSSRGWLDVIRDITQATH